MEERFFNAAQPQFTQCMMTTGVRTLHSAQLRQADQFKLSNHDGPCLLGHEDVVGPFCATTL